jgi:chromosomal replication initiation ATPase DnaA
LEIAVEFNMRQYSSVSSVVNKMIQLIEQDRKIRKRVQGIENKINKGQT